MIVLKQHSHIGDFNVTNLSNAFFQLFILYFCFWLQRFLLNIHGNFLGRSTLYWPLIHARPALSILTPMFCHIVNSSHKVSCGTNFPCDWTIGYFLAYQLFLYGMLLRRSWFESHLDQVFCVRYVLYSQFDIFLENNANFSIARDLRSENWRNYYQWKILENFLFSCEKAEVFAVLTISGLE